MFGASLLMLFALEACYRAQGALRQSLRATRATAAAREPYDGLPWYPGYLADERATAVVRWRPYVYHRRIPFAGRYISIDTAGLRHTVQTTPPAADTIRIFLFGGSTMFGAGQRDSNTIASVFASRLSTRHNADVTYEVTNYGQAGYVFTQEVLELVLRLREGARPDMVVFYDGLNDVASAVQNGVPGDPQNEDNRVREFEFGRTVFLGQGGDLDAAAKLVDASLARLRIFQRLNIALARRGVSGEVSDSFAVQIAATYANTARVVEALAPAYGFRTLYVWQPSLHHTGKRLTPFEVHLQGILDADPFQQRQRALHRMLPALMARAMADVAPGRYVDISGVFDTDTLTAYTDAVGHNTERAIPAIVDAFAPTVLRMLEAPRHGSGPRP